MKNNTQEILKRFDNEFKELWGSNDGREGYAKEVSEEVKQFLEQEITKVLEKVVPEEIAIPTEGETLREHLEAIGYNSCREQIKQNINNFLNK